MRFDDKSYRGGRYLSFHQARHRSGSPCPKQLGKGLSELNCSQDR